MHVKQLICLILIFTLSITVSAQSIGSFNSIQPTGQTEQFVLPSTHTFQRIIRSGDMLPSGEELGVLLDFTGYVPIGGSNTNGYLSISSESFPAECAILSISFNPVSKTWITTDGGKVSFPPNEIGTIARFCSGTVTPDNTIMVGEEAVINSDVNGDGYQDIGWVIEIDPATRTVINQDGIAGADKLWALGRQSHENVVVKNDESVIYWGADAHPTGYMYKFVPDVAGNYTAGNLYVLETNATLGTGTWKLLNNSTVADRNNTVTLSTAAGAYNFNGIEDVEIGPDNKIYFAAKGPGVIYRFRDLGNSVDQLEVFVSSTNYDVDGTGPIGTESWGLGNDNLAFDGEGNLWVLQDGSRNHIWVVNPAHSAASPAIRLFATTPLGSEPTGITFTPDYKYMFISFQHPNGSNTTAQADAASASVVFNTHTTVVVARKEFLGLFSTFPVTFTAFDLAQKNDEVVVSWTVESISNHDYFELERSVDGVLFSPLKKFDQQINNLPRASMTFTDDNLPAAPYIYYRIKQCDKNGSCKYSATRLARNSGFVKTVIYPQPAGNNLNVRYFSNAVEDISFFILNAAGSIVHKEIKKSVMGMNNFNLHTGNLKTGNYFLILSSASDNATFQFTRANE